MGMGIGQDPGKRHGVAHRLTGGGIRKVGRTAAACEEEKWKARRDEGIYMGSSYRRGGNDGLAALHPVVVVGSRVPAAPTRDLPVRRGDTAVTAWVQREEKEHGR
jgi:hypothetical protein